MNKRYNIEDLGSLTLGFQPTQELTYSNYKFYLLEDYDFFPSIDEPSTFIQKNIQIESDALFGSNNVTKMPYSTKYGEFVVKEKLNLDQNYINEFYFYFRYYGGVNLTTELRDLLVEVETIYGDNVIPMTFSNLQRYVNNQWIENDMPCLNSSDGGVSIYNSGEYNQTTGTSLVMVFYETTNITNFNSYEASPDGYNFRVKCFSPLNNFKAKNNTDYRIRVRYYNINKTEERVSKVIKVPTQAPAATLAPI